MRIPVRPLRLCGRLPRMPSSPECEQFAPFKPYISHRAQCQCHFLMPLEAATRSTFPMSRAPTPTDDIYSCPFLKNCSYAFGGDLRPFTGWNLPDCWKDECREAPFRGKEDAGLPETVFENVRLRKMLGRTFLCHRGQTLRPRGTSTCGNRRNFT